MAENTYSNAQLAAALANSTMPNASGDPIPASGTPGAGYKDKYYEANATLAHFKDVLNDKLKAKDPKAFKEYFQKLVELRRSGDTTAAQKYTQEAPYNEYLSPQEVQKTLGKEDYDKYLNALQEVNSYNVSQKLQPLYGGIEGEQDVNNLNYGRRFASLQITPSVSVFNQTRGTNYNRDYTYDPKTKQVIFKEGGDLSLRPSYLMPTK